MANTEQLIDQILEARSGPEIEAARSKALAHLEVHPEDTEVRFAMEQLAMVELARQ